MVACPKCGRGECVKDGIVKERQRFRCKGCHYRHTVRERGAGKAKQKQALQLYLAGLGFRSIGRFLGVSHVAAYRWIRAHGEALDELRSETGIEVVAMDELYSYLGSKKTTVGSGLLLIVMAAGSSTAFWVPGKPTPDRGYGSASKTKRLGRL
jgi:transposase-like protein